MRTNLVNTEPIKKDKIKNSRENKSPTIHIIHILDSSSSMGGEYNSRYSAAKEGMEEELIELNKESLGIKYTYTVKQFSNATYGICTKKDIIGITIKDLALIPSGGKTALYDCIGNTLSTFECSPEDKVIVKIFTDGGENYSKFYHKESLSALIKEKEKLGWVITFVGTQVDTDKMINSLSLHKGNTLAYDGSAQGLRQAYTTSNQSRIMYAKAVLDGTDGNVKNNFFGSYN